MNKNITIGIIVIATLLLVGGYFIFFNQEQENNIQEGQQNAPAIKPTTKDISQLLLSETDLPSGYKVADRAPRVKSDVSEFGQNLGWIEGYRIRFIKGETIFDSTGIEQSISKYPIENITQLVRDKTDASEGWIAENLPDPKIGDKSRAISYKNIEFGNREYTIEFIKKDVYMSITISGIATDYELLKEITKKMASKI